MFKALLLYLEREIKARILFDHPIIPWLLSHGAMLRTLLVKGDDGKTAHQRARGCDGPKRLLAFGELCRTSAERKKEVFMGANGASAPGCGWGC